jgi:heme oxygenase
LSSGTARTLPGETRALLPLLRAGTAEAHRNLHARRDIPALCQSVPAYEAWLLRLYGFYGPLEKKLRAVPGWEELGFHWAEREKTALLRDDLLALGASPAKIAEADGLPDLPQFTTLAEACGGAYALEDATLDSAQFLMAMKRSPIPAGARKFVTSYGNDLGNKWREFCGVLDRLDAGESEAVIRNANGTFAGLSAWLAGGPSRDA